jgi:PAS domain-containing protein
MAGKRKSGSASRGRSKCSVLARDAEPGLLESERQYRQLFDSMTEGFLLIEMIVDETGRPVSYRVLDANPALERLTQLKCKDVMGRDAREVLGTVGQHWIEAFGRVAQTGASVHLEAYSEALRASYDVYAYCPQRGQVALIYTNVTERKRAEQELRDKEERFRSVLEDSQDVIYRLNLQTRHYE